MIIVPATRRHQDMFPRFFNDLFENDFAPVFADEFKQFNAPKVNIIETENGYQIELAQAGMTKEGLKVSVENENELTISIEKKNEQNAQDDKQATKKTYLRREFSTESFTKVFILPEDVDVDKISAKMENGVLTLDLVKKEKVVPQPRQINII